MSEKRKIALAVDAMGGDNAPEQIVKGCVLAAKEYNTKLYLVGKQDEIQIELDKYDIEGLDLEIIHASETIDMCEVPTKAIKRKKDSSIVVALNLVKEGKAEGFVSAGNTGACMTGSFFILGRIKGIERPAIAALLPTVNRTPAILIDAGANSDCEPSYLVQFAQMGSVLSEKVFGVPNPRVAVLNIGGESSKGNALSLATHKMLKEDSRGLNFVGNIEGRDVFLGGCDVMVCDGFTGNVTLKVAEGVAKMLISLLKEELSHGKRNILGAALAMPAFSKLKKRIDYEEYGGSLLLGVNGITIIAHGGSNSFAIKNAIRVGVESAQNNVTKLILDLCDKSTV